jgi:hypothetical protein
MRSAMTWIAAAALVLSSATGVFAQAKPDFSGKWTMDPASAPAAPAGGGGGGGRGGGRGGGGAGFGQEFTAKQDAGTLTITRQQGGQDVTAAYKLDGSESKNTVAGRGGQQEQVSTAKWDGSKLVITTKLDFGGTAVEQVRTISMDAGKLVIEQSQAGRDGGAPTTTKVVYNKS